MRCLVTGASGFIGRALCPELLARHWDVVGHSRRAPVPEGVRPLHLDLGQAAMSPAQLHGVDVVVHLAGIAHRRAAPGEHQRINCDASLALAGAAAAAGVRHFIYLSSVKAMGPAADARARAETEVRRCDDPYGLSKWEAEQGLAALPASAAMAITILRPALVYGPQPKGNLALLDRGVDLGLPRLPEQGGRSMVALPDLVDLLCELAAADLCGTHTWIVSDGRSYSSRTIYDALRARRGLPPARSWCPRWLWMAASGALGLRAKLFGSEHYDNAALLAATRWRPQHDLASVLGQQAQS